MLPAGVVSLLPDHEVTTAQQAGFRHKQLRQNMTEGLDDSHMSAHYHY